MEPTERTHPTSRACPAPKTSACASRRTISRRSRRCWAPSWSTTPPTSASPSSCGPSTSPIPLHGKLFDSLSRLIERGQVVSAVTLKTYVEQDEDMKAAGGAAYLARLAAASVHVIDADGVRPGGARPLPAPPAHRSRRGRGQRRLRRRRRRDRAAADRGRREEALRPRERRPDRGRLQAVPRRADRGDGRGRGGLPPRRPAHRRRHRPRSSSTSSWAACTGRTSSSWPAVPRWERPRSPPTSPSTPPRPIARSIVERQAQGGRRRGGRLLLARNVVRAARHPHARRAGRGAVGEDPQGRADQQRLRQGPVGQPRARAPQLLHRRHAGAVDRRAAHPRPPAEAHARARPAGRRLPPAPRALGQDRARRTACRRSRRSPAA